MPLARAPDLRPHLPRFRLPAASLSPRTATFLPPALPDARWRLEGLAAARPWISPAQRPSSVLRVRRLPDSWPRPLGVPGEHPSLPPSSHPDNLRNHRRDGPVPWSTLWTLLSPLPTDSHPCASQGLSPAKVLDPRFLLSLSPQALGCLEAFPRAASWLDRCPSLCRPCPRPSCL